MKILILIQKPQPNSIQLAQIGRLIKKDILVELLMGVYLSDQLKPIVSIII